MINSVREFDVFIRLSLLCDPIFPGEVNRVDFTCGPGYKFGSLAAPLVEGVFLRWVEPASPLVSVRSKDCLDRTLYSDPNATTRAWPRKTLSKGGSPSRASKRYTPRFPNRTTASRQRTEAASLLDLSVKSTIMEPASRRTCTSEGRAETTSILLWAPWRNNTPGNTSISAYRVLVVT